MAYDPIILHDARLNTEIIINLHFIAAVYLDKQSGYVIVNAGGEKHFLLEGMDDVKRLMGMTDELPTGIRKSGRKFAVSVSDGSGAKKYIGTYATLEEAEAARDAAKATLCS